VSPPAKPAEDGVPFSDIDLLHPSRRVYEAIILQATGDHGASGAWPWPLFQSSFSLQ
jgi:hypothetical protein